MERALLWEGSVNWIERAFVLILILPIIGLLDDALGRYSGISWTRGLERLWSEPALIDSLILSLWVASASLIISLFIARAMSAKTLQVSDSGVWRSVLLAMPHSALAVGLLLALSTGGVGWRWISVFFELPLDQQYLFPRDPWGMGTILSLVIKESAFLIAIAIPITKRLPLRSYQVIARQAGLTQIQCHHQLIWPQVIRLMWPAIFVVFVFGLTNLEVSLILGPDQPQLIGVRLFQLLTDPNALNRQAGALGLLILLVLLVGVWGVFHRLTRPCVKDRLPDVMALTDGVTVLRWTLITATWLSIVSLLIWAVTLRWSVLEPLPYVSLSALTSLESLKSPFWTSLLIGLTTSVIAIVLAVCILEYLVSKGQKRLHWIWWAFLWLPALPMASGLLAWIYFFGGSPGLWPVILGHTLIALPYVMIVVSDSWFDRDWRHEVLLKQAGLTVWRQILLIWMPRHSRLLVLAFALAFAVSCALYTQTILLGGGRIETLMTELMVTVGGERRPAAVTGLVNVLLPLIAFGLALWVNRISWRHRVGMQGDGYADFR
jgi:putative thiamine transport system permease protein